MPTKVLPLDLIQVLGSVQPRQTLNEDAIADYAEHYKPDADGKAPLPPLRVFKDGEQHILSRGFHRYTAAQRAKRESLACEILDGGERAAILDAMQDNGEHGVRLTPADKRKAVNRLLDDAEWGKLTQAKVAELANVSLGLVRLIVAERKPKDTETGGKLNSVPPESGRNVPGPKPGTKGGIKATTEPKADAAADKPTPWDNITSDKKTRDKLAELKPGQAELTRLSEKSMDDQPGIVKLIDGDKVKTLGQAIGEFDGKPGKRKGGAAGKALTGEEAEAFDARAQVKVWAETIGRWLQQLPSIDGYRKKYPGKEGDRVVKAATELYEALKLWEKKIK